MSERECAQEMLDQCVAGRAHQIARIVTAQYDEALKPHAITSNQLTLLCMIALQEPVQPGAMLPYLKMEQSTLSRNLDRLESKGWLERVDDEKDARSNKLSLTPDGKAKMRAARESWQQAQDRVYTLVAEGNLAGLGAMARELNPLMPALSIPKD